MKLLHLLLTMCCFCFAGTLAQAADQSKPNIIFILADDLGYGDVQVLNPERGKIKTPHMDAFAAQGMIFTDAHSGSSVCTPTRYGVLTGRYAWRTKLQSGVLGGYSQPLIDPERLTVARLLQENGYKTACIGKWHLGMNWTLKEGGFANSPKDANNVDYTAPIKNGPITNGFTYYYGISASLDMPPYVFIENDRLTALPTVEKAFFRKGLAAADFEAIDVLPICTQKATAFINEHAEASKQGQPFFVYMPLNSPHTPIVPTPEWQGKSGLGSYGDFVMQTDAAIGAVLAAVDKSGIADNTLIIITSDNGCSPAAKVKDLEQQGHFPSEQLRGYKADIWDGGHRVPYLVRWPAKIKAGTHCHQTVCLTDLMATCADIVGATIPENAGEDSFSLVPAFSGAAINRTPVVHHSINGNFALRDGNWKLDFSYGSGGWASPNEAAAIKDGAPNVQLYDMGNDKSEAHNLQAENPDMVAKLTTTMEQLIANGRSTPGAAQKNDVEVKLFKEPKGKKK